MEKSGISVSSDDDVVVVAVNGTLGGDTARALLAAAASAAASRAPRLRIDLRNVCSVTGDGVVALTGCRRLDGILPGGVTFFVTGGEGSKGLLASLSSAP